MQENRVSRTCNKPGKEETVQRSIERVRPGIFVVAILLLVANSLYNVGQILDNAEASADNEIDWYVAFVRAVVQIHGSCSRSTSVTTVLIGVHTERSKLLSATFHDHAVGVSFAKYQV